AGLCAVNADGCRWREPGRVRREGEAIRPDIFLRRHSLREGCLVTAYKRIWVRGNGGKFSRLLIVLGQPGVQTKGIARIVQCVRQAPFRVAACTHGRAESRWLVGWFANQLSNLRSSKREISVLTAVRFD